MEGIEVQKQAAPLGLEREFPQYVWVALIGSADRNEWQVTIIEGEAFAICFESRKTAMGYAESKAKAEVVDDRSWWQKPFLVEPKPSPVSAEEWPFEELAQKLKGYEARTDQGSFVRGFALLDEKAKPLAKRYCR